MPWADGARDVMSNSKAKLTFEVEAWRADAHGSRARCKNAEIVLDTDLAGRAVALNPAELLLAALAACMLKSIERVARLQLQALCVAQCGRRGSTEYGA